MRQIYNKESLYNCRPPHRSFPTRERNNALHNLTHLQLMKQLEITEHFRTPEGYFESLTKQIMGQLPNQQQQRRPAAKRKLVAYIAACLTVLVLMTFAYTTYEHSTADKATAAKLDMADAPEEDDINSVEEAAYYTMIDDTKLHYIITEQQ